LSSASPGKAWLAAVSVPLSLHLQGAEQPESPGDRNELNGPGFPERRRHRLAARTERAVVAIRKRLDDPTKGDTREVHAVEFESATPMDWRPGDLLLISPAEDQPDRCYSIGSTPRADDRHLLLTVALRQSVGKDGTIKTGAASGLLCHDLPVGAMVHARLRRHPAFNPPEDPQRAIIMLATGCGIAPFIGFLADREVAGSRGASWLLFGNRHRGADFLHGDRLGRWARNGVLARLDTAFSRDAGVSSYVQDIVVRNAAELWNWLEKRNAILYACGGHATLGLALDDALCRVAMAGGKLSPEVAAAIVGRWRAEGRIRCDLID
jgi:sulfite reductase (NADPH) flavoprotein alpha-component